MEMSIMTDAGEMGLGGMGRLMKDGANGYGPVYKRSGTFNRGSSFRVEKLSSTEFDLVNIDGEDWEYKKFVKTEIIPQGLEVLFDAKTHFLEKQTFL
jgi:hypothetical protein